MRKTFAGYYRPTNTEFRKLWDKCLFVLDANVLLNLYRYSEETRKKLLDILHRIEDRLWVPHQAALEYQRNRLDVISAQRQAYNEIEQHLLETGKKLDTQLKSYKKHPLISTDKLSTAINEVIVAEVEKLKGIRQRHPDLLDNDEVRETLTKLLTGKVGPPYSEEKLRHICKEGEDRYAKSKPPGYKDAKSKDGDRAFGDLILWFQVIDKAEAEKVPMVIVTDDVKEDWWWRHEGRIIGPNPQLVEEIYEKAKVNFYMYASDKFMEYAREYLKQHVDQKAIEEIRELRRIDEQQRLHQEGFMVNKRRHLNELRHDLALNETELGQLGTEIARLNLQLGEIATGAASEMPESGRLERVAQLSRQLTYLQERFGVLQDRRHKLAHRLELEMEERNIRLQQDPRRVHFVKSADGKIQRILRPEYHLK